MAGRLIEIDKNEFMKELKKYSPKNETLKKGEFYNSILIKDKYMDQVHLVTEFFNGKRQFYKKI